MAGVEHIKGLELSVGNVVAKLIARAKDGIGVDDAIALVTDSSFRADLAALVEHGKHVKEEATDLTGPEYVELIQPTANLVTTILKAATA